MLVCKASILSVALSAALLSGCGDKPASGAGAAQASALTFTAGQATNAFGLVAALTAERTPRDAGTPGAERAARWIADRLIERGLEARIDTFTEPTPRGPKRFHNVLAEITGASGEWIVLLSHFDTMSGIGGGFEGANDSGSSTGLLIEIAAALRAAGPHRHNLLFGFMDGEECMVAYSGRDGFHGSKRLARQLKASGSKIRAVILMDMVGDRDLKLTVPRNSTGALRLLALEAAETVGDRSKIGLFDGVIYDDHQAFLDLGYPAVNLIDFEFGSRPGRNDYWHTPADTMDKICADSLLVTGRIVMEMLNRLAADEK
ncbi:MAG: M28 family metallopeptidase [Kiritimatiellae bacterium]|nr:M28 family metallopeptidase [Kiritimatiellia bacterium]